MKQIETEQVQLHVKRDSINENNDLDPDDCEERQTWSGQFEFVLSLVGYTVGLGNLWRFPYFCYRNGGGIALVPFLLFLTICGGPLYYMEICIGQFSGQSPITVWNLCPLFKGIGIVMISTSLIYLWYYGTAFGWVLYFLFQSFHPTLPWSNCGNSWNTDLCIDATTNITAMKIRMNTTIFRTSGTEFWERNVLKKSSGIEEMGSIQPHLAACLFLGWFLVFLCLAKGVKSMGKVVYVTATVPYLLLTILMIRGVTLDGAWIGLRIYLIPDFSKLANGQMWVEAAIQCFYSLGPAWGGLITMASFNKFHHKALRDTVIACVADGFTALYGGLVIFSVLGYLSKETGTSLDNLPFSGAGLAFIAYPEALSRLPMPNVWSVLFFLTLVFVAIGTQFATFETAANAIVDLNYKKLHKYRIWVAASLGGFLFITGLPLTTSGGYYLFMLVDWYVAMINIVFTAFIECVVIAWIYGANRFSCDIEMMSGSRPSKLVRITWVYCIPIFIGSILITTILNYSGPSIGYDYPFFTLVLGNIVAFAPLSSVFVIGVIQLIKTEGSIKQRFSYLMKPARSWLPNDKEQRKIFLDRPYQYQHGFKQRYLVDIIGLKDE